MPLVETLSYNLIWMVKKKMIHASEDQHLTSCWFEKTLEVTFAMVVNILLGRL